MFCYCGMNMFCYCGMKMFCYCGMKMFCYCGMKMIEIPGFETNFRLQKVSRKILKLSLGPKDSKYNKWKVKKSFADYSSSLMLSIKEHSKLNSLIFMSRISSNKPKSFV